MIRNQYKVLTEKYNLVKENEDEDLLAGVDKAFDELSPNNKIVYGTLTLGRNGNLVNYIPAKPSPCPKNAVYVAKNMYVIPGQEVDLVYNPLEVLIVDEQMAKELLMWYKGRTELSEEIESALDQLNSNLNLNSDTPVLPESKNEDEDLLAGINKASDEFSPEGKLIYGKLMLDYGGLFVGYQPYQIPIKLASNFRWISPGVFALPGQDPDYVKVFPTVFITDKKLADMILYCMNEEPDNWPAEMDTFEDQLNKGLGITDDNEIPRLPQ